MPITFTNVLAAGSGVDGTTHTTASFTPVAGRLYLVSMTERNGSSTNPGQPTASFSGSGLAALTVPTNGSLVYDNSSGSRRRLTVFYALASGTPTAGTITFTHSASMTSADWSIEAVTGIDTTTPVVQAANDFTPAATPGVTRTATLATFGSTDNVAFGAGASGQALAPMSPGSGFTALSSAVNDGENGQWLITEYKLSNDNTVDVSGDNEIGVVGLEIKAGAVSGQTISASGIASTAVIGTPTLLAGAVAVAAVGIASALAIGYPTLLSISTITPSAISSTATIGSPSLTPGTVTSSPAGKASSAVIGSPALAPGAVTIASTGINSGASVGAPTLSSALAVPVTGIASTSALGAPTLALGAVTASPSGITSTAALGSPTLSSSYTASVNGIASTGTIGTPTIISDGGDQTLSIAGISSTVSVGSPTLVPGAISAPVSGIASSAALGAPTLLPGAASIAPAGIASPAQIGTPSFTSAAILTVSGIDSTITIGNPTLLAGAEEGEAGPPEEINIVLIETALTLDLETAACPVDLLPTPALDIDLASNTTAIVMEPNTLSADLKANTITADI